MSANDSDPKSTILEVTGAVVAEWHEAARIIADQQARQNALSARYADLQAAARVFGFDLDSEYQIWMAKIVDAVASRIGDNSVSINGPVTVTATAEAAPTIPPPKARTIKEIVLEAAKEAYPKAIRASGVRNLLGMQGFNVHDKTVGMTLYRLSREGAIKRVGKADWFFIPENERQNEESPADTGLLFNKSA